MKISKEIENKLKNSLKLIFKEAAIQNMRITEVRLSSDWYSSKDDMWEMKSNYELPDSMYGIKIRKL